VRIIGVESPSVKPFVPF